MNYSVYVLESEKNGARYIGYTHDLVARLREHNIGRNVSTRSKGPWKLIHHENYLTELLARQREAFLKSGHGRTVLKNLLSQHNGA